MSADILRPVFARIDEAPLEGVDEQSWQIDLEEVLALESLVRQSAIPAAAHKGRKIWQLHDEPFTLGFCVMQWGSYDVQEGFNDRFVAVRLEEREVSSGSLILSFLKTQKLPKSKVIGIRSIHRFGWTPEEAYGNVLKVRTGKPSNESDEEEFIVYGVHDKPSGTSTKIAIFEPSDTSSSPVVRPPQEDETYEIADRMMDIISAAIPRKPNSRSAMNCANYYLDMMDRAAGLTVQ
jgi:hypothetical protein